MFLNPKNKTANSGAKGVKNGNGKIEHIHFIPMKQKGLTMGFYEIQINAI